MMHHSPFFLCAFVATTHSHAARSPVLNFIGGVFRAPRLASRGNMPYGMSDDYVKIATGHKTTAAGEPVPCVPRDEETGKDRGLAL